MPVSTTMTIRLSPDLKDKLDRLVRITRRSKSFLAVEATSAYVDRELEIVEGIQRGLADVRAGRTVPHEQVVAEIAAMLDAIEARKASPK